MPIPTDMTFYRRLAHAAEFRTDESEEHIHRMSQYCALIGKQLGLRSEYCEELRLASSLHDVGKLWVPKEILLKPTRLTGAEWQVMRAHSRFGYQLLSGMGTDLLDLAAEIALTHHERWDGTGYPTGLAGDAIPLSGRIAAVADVFDALTSARVYKKAFSVDSSLESIRDGRGTHFDPQVVDAFFDCVEEILIAGKFPVTKRAKSEAPTLKLLVHPQQFSRLQTEVGRNMVA